MKGKKKKFLIINFIVFLLAIIIYFSANKNRSILNIGKNPQSGDISQSQMAEIVES